MGITKKVIVPLNDVTKVTKAKSLGLLKAIKIYTSAGKKNSYKFQSFSDCNKTYKIIHKLWSNVSPNAVQDTGDSEEEDNEDDQSNSSTSRIKDDSFSLNGSGDAALRKTEQVHTKNKLSYGDPNNTSITNASTQKQEATPNNLIDQVNLDQRRTESNKINPNRLSVTLFQNEEIKKDDDAGISLIEVKDNRTYSVKQP